MSSSPIIVAELSANHLGDLSRALTIIDAAAEAGADAVKFQTYDPDQMVGDPNWRIESGPWRGRRLRDLYEEAHTPREWHPALFERCRVHGMTPFSSPFHPDDVAFLETLGCPWYKIASFELTDLDLIRTCAATGKPIIMSTGMAYPIEITQAVQAAKGAESITLLRCTSAYPATAKDAHLKAMIDLRMQCGTDIGLSDHTKGIGVAVAAAALGARMIEKHLTLSRADGGPDAAFSMEPHEFAQMVAECHRAAEASTWAPAPGPTDAEIPSLHLRRSLWFAADLPEGTEIKPEHIRTARPALGVAGCEKDRVIGGRLTAPVTSRTPVTWELVE